MTIPSDDIRKVAKEAGPLDDVFFIKLGEDALTIEEIISTILNIPIKVKNAVPQYSITNIGSRGVRLDNYAKSLLRQSC